MRIAGSLSRQSPCGRPLTLSPALTRGQRHRRRRVDLAAGTVRVVRQVTELSGGQLAPGPAKPDAGKPEPAKPSSVGHAAGTAAPERLVKIGYGHVESAAGLGV